MSRRGSFLVSVAEELAIINWEWRFQNLTSEIVFAKKIGPERFLQARRCNHEDTGTGQIIERGLSAEKLISEIQNSLVNYSSEPFFLEVTDQKCVKITIT